jgi:hypothetical protein
LLFVRHLSVFCFLFCSFRFRGFFLNWFAIAAN